MYIPNPDSVKVGYGYRLLGDDEIPIRHEDDVIYGEIKWEKADGLADYPLKTVKYYNDTFSESAPIYYRRKIEIPEGYILLEKDKAVKNENIKFIQHHFNASTTSINWYNNDSMGCPKSGTPIEFWGGKTSIEQNGVAYIQKIETKMNEIEQIKKDLEAAKASIAQLEKKLGESVKNEIKVGDYIAIGGNGIVKVKNIDNGKVYFDDLTWMNLGCQHRKATNNEISKYLLDKAAKDGWVLGAKIKDRDEIYSISDLFVSFNGRGSSVKVEEYYEMKGEPFVVVVVKYRDNMCSLPITQLELLKEDPITITVKGMSYIAEFIKDGHNDYVKFGCATIRKEQITHALRLIENDGASTDKIKNRQIEAVQIGKGLFTLELLKKLVKKFDKSE